MASGSNSSSYYQMKNGLVVMQAEDGVFVNKNNPENDTWKLTNQFPGTKGDGALLWTGKDYFNKSNAGTDRTAPLEYNFEVSEPGTYYISLRAARPVTGEPGDRNNDFFVQFEDEGFTKLFFSGDREKFTWATRYDAGHVKSDATFNVTQSMINQNDGVFTLTLSARSHMAAVDEIHINKGKFSRDSDAPTSKLVNGDTTPQPPAPPQDEDNEAPNAVNDFAETGHNKTILIDVISNDDDPDGDPLTLTKVSYSGTTSNVTIEDGKIKVNPRSSATEERTETITYTVKDSKGATDTGTLKVDVASATVTPVPTPPDTTPPTEPNDNVAPIAVDDVAQTGQNKTIFVDVTSNDSDPDGNTVTLTDVSYDGNTSGVSIEDGKIKVNPHKDDQEDRIETITYTITDADGATATATLEVAVGNPGDVPTPPEPPTPPSNAAPVAKDDFESTGQNKTILVDVLDNDSDPEGGALTLTEVSYDGTTSRVSIQDNMIKVNPLRAATEDRTETITYTVTDDKGASQTATLRVDVGNPVTVPPSEPEEPEQPSSKLKLFIADADTDETLRDLVDGATFDADSLGDNFTFYATSAYEEVAFVTLEFGDITTTEKVEPYALFGDKAGDFNGGLDLEPGSYALVAEAFDANNKLLETVDVGFDLF